MSTGPWQSSKWKLPNLSDEEWTKLAASSTSVADIQRKLGLKGGCSFRKIQRRIRDLGLTVETWKRSWNKGETKSSSSKVAALGLKISVALKGKHRKPLSQAHREKLSKAASDRSSTNGYVRTRWYSVWCPLMNRYVSVQGTWERNYARWLNQSGVPWIRSRELYLTWTKGETDITHRYFPDFYLPDTDVYVEIKGYLWKSGAIDDEQKMRLVATCNPNATIHMLMEQDLKRLAVI